MTHRRPLAATLSFAVLAGCAPAGLAPSFAVVAPRPAVDRVSTLAPQAYQGTDLMLDAGDRLHTVNQYGIQRLDAQGVPTPLLNAGIGTTEGFFHPSAGAFAPDGTLFLVGAASRLDEVAPDGKVRRSVPLPCLDGRFGVDVALNSRGEAFVTMGCGVDAVPPRPTGWIAKVGADGQVRPFAGNPDAAAGFADSADPLQARFAKPIGLAFDAEDHLYVADRDNACIRRVTPAGAVTTLMTGVEAVAIAVARSGDLFYATADNRVWQVSPDGQARLLAGTGRVCANVNGCTADGPGLQAEFNQIRSLVVARDGALHVLEGSGDDGRPNRVRRIDWLGGADPNTRRPGPRQVVATAPAPTPPAPTAVPTSIPAFGADHVEAFGRVYDAAGRPVTEDLEIWASFADHMEIQKLLGRTQAGAFRVRTPRAEPPYDLVLRGAGVGERRRPFTGGRYYGDGPEGRHVNFGGPATSEDPDAPAYFLPPQGPRRGYFRTAIGRGEPATVTTVAGPDAARSLEQAGGMAVRPDGTVVVAARQVDAVLAVAPDGSTRRLGGIFAFKQPNDVALAPDGAVYVAQGQTNAILRIAPDDQVTTLATIEAPLAIAVGPDGGIYCATGASAGIQRIDPTGTVAAFAGSNRDGGWANGPRLAARFRRILDLAFGPDGSLYVADVGNYRVRRIDPAGEVFDHYGAVVATEGPGFAQLPALDIVSRLDVDRQGRLIAVSPDFMARVYQIAPNGDTTVLAGSIASGKADGPAGEATFAGIRYVAVGPADAIYVGDGFNAAIRKVTRN